MPDPTPLYPQYQPQPNPLTTVANVFQLRNQQNENALFQQEFGARKAIGQAYQQATNPLTGELDTGKLSTLIAGNPASAFMASQAMQEALARRQAQLGIDTTAQDLAMKRQGAANMVLGSTLAKVDSKGNFVGTKADALSSIAEAHRTGMLDDQQTGGWINDIAGLPDDPATLQGYLQQHVVQGVSPGERAGLVLGAPQAVGTGAGTQYANVSPLSGVKNLGFIPTTLSPADLAAKETWTTKDNITHQGTHGQFLDAVGAGLATPGSNTPAGGAPSAIGGSLVGPGRITPAGPIAGPSPGTAEAAIATAGESAKQGIALQQLADQAPALKGAYQNMAADLKDFTPGPGADWTKAAKSLTNRLDPAFLQKLGIQFDPQSIASQESFTKLANQIALAQGAQSDMHLTIAGGANPNAELSKLGIQQILGRLQGVQDSVSAKNQAWQNYQQQNGSAGYGKFSSDFNKNFDQRVFQSNYMTPAERSAMVSKMTSAEKKDFNSKLHTAVANGWVDPSTWSAPGGR